MADVPEWRPESGISIWDHIIMCASKGSVQYPISDAAQLAQYQRIAQQQYEGINPYNQGLAQAFSLTRKAVEDNQYKQEMVAPVVVREPTVEDFRSRLERKLDLDEGGDDAKRTQEAGSDGGCKRRDGTGGSDAG